MKAHPLSSVSRVIAILLSLIGLGLSLGNQLHAQEPSQEVIRVNTDLVQTSLTVVDRNGKFVEGLRPEQFELRIDGKPRSISFFEQVIAGSEKESQLTAPDETLIKHKPVNSAVVRGRTIIFFIDDLHLSLQSVDRTRRMLLNFIDTEMSSRDQVAIASASGQIDFLQQFTNNKDVLHAAVMRLKPKPYVVNGYGTGKAPMTEYVALNIDNRSDQKITDFYIEECLKQTDLPRKTASLMRTLRETCNTQVRNSARAVLMQAADVTRATYASLQSLMQSSARRSGRKLAFFVSDGFLLDFGTTASLSDKLMQIISTAQKAGVVVYTIDAKGLVSPGLDATNNVPLDPNARLETLAMRAIVASQDALHALAVDTGGRALRNTNVFDRWVGDVLKETSSYYLLAWRPDTEEQKEKKFRKVEVSVVGRPDLSIRLPKGYLEAANNALVRADKSAAAKNEAAPSTPARVLGDALTDFYTRSNIPTKLSLSYLNTPDNGMVLTAATQIATHALSFGQDGKQSALVDLAGVVLNDKGKVVNSFKNRLSAKSISSERSDESSLIYNHRIPLSAGIYQVRVAVRDNGNGRVGSAMEWVVVPDTTAKQLTLSSVLLGGKMLASQGSMNEPQIQFSVDHRFSRNEHLSFWVFIYNATTVNDAAKSSSLTAQVQVLREGQPLATNKQQLNTKGVSDPARIPFSADLALKNLEAGYYQLRITVADLVANTTASQSVEFEVQ
jgi:VWFA-related protein